MLYKKQLMRWLSAVGPLWTVLLSGDFDRTIGEICLGDVNSITDCSCFKRQLLWDRILINLRMDSRLPFLKH
jgi:hypothetical protein